MPALAKLTVKSPYAEDLYHGMERDRRHRERDEGPIIVLELSGDLFPLLKKIRAMPVLDIHRPFHNASLDDRCGSRQERNERRQARWEANLIRDRTGTLYANGTHVIDAMLGAEPNLLCIFKKEGGIHHNDIHWVLGEAEMGSQGTRAFGSGDPAIITRALKNKLGIDLPESFERDLREGIARATPARGHPDTPQGSYADFPGQPFEKHYDGSHEKVRILRPDFVRHEGRARSK